MNDAPDPESESARERRIFLDALEIESEKEQEAFLDRACGTDLALKQRIVALIESEQCLSDAFLPADGVTPGQERRHTGSDPFSPGDSIVLVGDYELLDEIARGAMGIVYRARQHGLNRIVALKMIRDQSFASEEEIRRFRVEAEAAAALDHPNIVPIYEIDEHEGHSWFSMKLIEPGSLAKADIPREDGGRAAVELVVKVARAIQAAHERGILHRDIKPGNILIDYSGEPHVVDFGIAKIADSEADITLTGQIMGTPQYMSPEQASGDTANITVGTDVYSLGAVLYELLTGGRVLGEKKTSHFELIQKVIEEVPTRPGQLVSKLDRDLDVVVMKCLEKTPSDRYHSAAGLADDLERWLRGEPILARRTGRLERLRKWAKRRPVHAALAVVAALLVLTFAVGGPITAIRQAELRGLADRRADELQEGLYVTRMNLAATARGERRGIERVADLVDLARPQSGREDLRGWEWYFLNGLSNSAIVSRENPNPWKGARWSPDGSEFLSSTEDHKVEISDGITGVPKFVLPGHGNQVLHGSWSPDGKRFATCSRDLTAKIWDRDSQKCVFTLRGHTKYINSVEWSPDGDQLSSVSDDGTVKIWDANSGKNIRTLQGHRAQVRGAAWSRDGSRLASVSFDNSLRIWNVKTGVLLYEDLPPEADQLTDVDWSPDGTRIAAAGWNGEVHMWSADEPKRIHEWGPFASGIRCLRWSHSGEFLAVGGDDEAVTVIDASNGERVRTFRGSTHSIDCVDWSPEDDRIAAVGRGLQIFDLKSTRPVFRKSLGASLFAAKESPDGKWIAAAGRDSNIHILDRETLETVTLLPTEYHYLKELLWSPDSRRLIGGGTRYEAIEPVRKFQIWDVSTGEELATGLGTGNFLHDGAWSPDGKYFAMNDGAGKPHPVVYSTGDWEVAFKVQDHPVTVDAIAWSPDGRWLAAGGYSGDLRIYDGKTGGLVFSFPEVEERILSIAWHPAGNWIAVGGQSSRIGVYSWTRREMDTYLDGHVDDVGAVEWHPDGSRLASGSKDSTVRVWKTGSWDELVTLKEHQGEIRSISWSKDGVRLISSSFDGSVIVRSAGAGGYRK